MLPAQAALTARQLAENNAMKKVRVTMEHQHGEMTQHWKSGSVWWFENKLDCDVAHVMAKKRVLHSPHDCVVCCRHSGTSATFECPPPSLAAHLSMVDMQCGYNIYS